MVQCAVNENRYMDIISNISLNITVDRAPASSAITQVSH